jgi:hypothetical protein
MEGPDGRMLGWLNGRTPFPHDHPALLRLLEKASTARDELAAITEDL